MAYDFPIGSYHTDLERIFGLEFINELPKSHPLKRLYENSRDWLGRKPIDIESHQYLDEVFRLSRSMPDFFALWRLWSDPSGHSHGLNHRRFGDSVYAEDVIRDLRDPDKYLNQMLELWTAASILPVEKYVASPIARGSNQKKPDFRVKDTAGSTVALIECKNHSNWNSSQIENSVRYASKQIKQYADAENLDVPGIVVIGFLDNELSHGAAHLPVARKLLTQACNQVFRRFNSGRYSSVSRLYLVWDDIVIADDLTDYVTQLTTSRLVAVFDNPSAKLQLGTSGPYLNATQGGFQITEPSCRGVHEWQMIKPGANPSRESKSKILETIRNLNEFSGYRISPNSEIIFASNLRSFQSDPILDICVMKRNQSVMRGIWGRSILIDKVISKHLLPKDPENCLNLLLEIIGMKTSVVDRECHIVKRLLTLKDQSKPMSILDVQAPIEHKNRLSPIVFSELWPMCDENDSLRHSRIITAYQIAFAIDKIHEREEGLCKPFGFGMHTD